MTTPVRAARGRVVSVGIVCVPVPPVRGTAPTSILLAPLASPLAGPVVLTLTLLLALVPRALLRLRWRIRILPVPPQTPLVIPCLPVAPVGLVVLPLVALFPIVPRLPLRVRPRVPTTALLPLIVLRRLAVVVVSPLPPAGRRPPTCWRRAVVGMRDVCAQVGVHRNGVGTLVLVFPNIRSNRKRTLRPPAVQKVVQRQHPEKARILRHAAHPAQELLPRRGRILSAGSCGQRRRRRGRRRGCWRCTTHECQCLLFAAAEKRNGLDWQSRK
mmetsp:Transcript_19009/g.47578  ORF Transcript_19009/g.47578 Transcript_19009/m.47578 type:complete len:271 (+) Transcript_19009:265-1077(+)